MVTHECGQVMYVPIAKFVFMEAMVSCMINGEDTSDIWKSCFSIPIVLSCRQE